MTDSVYPGAVNSVPYVSGTGGYATYRIPAVVAAIDGTLLAFAEGRPSPADSGDIDLVLRRSVDGGATWRPVQVVAAGRGDTRGNPTPMVDPASGAIVLLSTGNGGSVTERQILRGEASATDTRRIFVQRSSDHGRTFTAPQEITTAVKRDDWRWYATGPGHGVALRTGPYAGRLVAPANHSVADGGAAGGDAGGAAGYGGHGLVSDDGGRTWWIGFVDEGMEGWLRPNETTAAGLPDGRIYLNTRNQGGSAPGTRGAAYSSDGGGTLDGPYRPEPGLVTPVVQGSVLALARAAGPVARSSVLLYAGPADPVERRAMAIRVSDDAGATWSPTPSPADHGTVDADHGEAGPGLVLSGGPAGYSDLLQLDADTIGLLYEAGLSEPHETIGFCRIPLEDVLRPGACEASPR